jgi:hypothetical protein
VHSRHGAEHTADGASLDDDGGENDPHFRVA